LSGGSYGQWPGHGGAAPCWRRSRQLLFYSDHVVCRQIVAIDETVLSSLSSTTERSDSDLRQGPQVQVPSQLAAPLVAQTLQAPSSGEAQLIQEALV